MDDFSRRDFIKGVVAAGLSLAATDGRASISEEPDNIKKPYDAKGLPVTTLGSTGVEIPKMVLGLGSRFCHIDDDGEAYEMLDYAIDNGLYYFDTAHIYDNTVAVPPGKKKSPRHIISEERIGEVVKYRRKEIFLSTKVTAREPDKSMKEIELSLKRLNTDKLDMLKIHDVQSIEDVDQMSKKGHLIDILHKLKEEGVTRFIGFSGHGDAQALKEMTNRGNFDSMLVAMNHWNPNHPSKREEIAIPAGKKKKMGVLLMKAVRPKETISGLHIPDLVSYAMSLEGPDAVVIGMDGKAVVKSNLDILRNFKKLSPERMKEMAVQLEPFYRHENLPWMQNNYLDGMWETFSV
jgi:predicted aldo/keto reductase-like oxidoreductase